MPHVKEAVKQYLRGIGHPHQARDFCDPETYDSEKLDPSLRARQFVKVLSGLDMMPVNESRNFMVFSSSFEYAGALLNLLSRYLFMRMFLATFSMEHNMMYVGFCQLFTITYRWHQCSE